jgi:hypothetical protein
MNTTITQGADHSWARGACGCSCTRYIRLANDPAASVDAIDAEYETGLALASLAAEHRQTAEACVWWSPTRAAWGCQIGNDRTFHYSEEAAIRHGNRLAAVIRRCSPIQVI